MLARHETGVRVFYPYGLLACIVLVAAALRFSGLDREGRWGDEYFQTMQYDQSPWYVVLGARTNNQPPLDFLIGWLVTKVARTTWMMRFPAACFGVASVAALYFLVRRLFGAGAGLLAAGVLATAPLSWRLSQEARPYTIFVFSMLVTLWLLVRAIDQPTWRRVLAYVASAGLMILTRGLAPHVVTLCCGLVLLAAWARSPRGSDLRAGLTRLLLGTGLVGMAGAGLLAFLVRGDAGWTVFADAGAARGSPVREFGAALLQNLRIWGDAPQALLGRGALPIVLLALLGAAWSTLRWRAWTTSTRCALGVMALLGPVYLVTYSAAVATHPICDRYAMFLTPVAATFAAAMIAGLLRHSFASAGNRRARWAAVTIAGAAIALPGASTLALARKCFHPDWRGSAELLGERYGADDVIMVFADRALGAGQSPYWGKLDWPTEHPPLGESMWTLATSEAHWWRLAERNGRCCLVLKYPVAAQDADAFRQAGLQAAPAGLALTKFRGLDVLEGFAGQDLAAQVISACDTVLALPCMHPDSRTIPWLLRSRAELARGERSRAKASYAEARACVPAPRRAWFDALTESYRSHLDAAPHPPTG